MKPLIQKQRALAVIAVLFFHLEPGVFPNAYLGVDIFFVISGYLIIPQIRKICDCEPQARRKLLRGFAAKRYLRIFPSLISAVLLTVTFGLAVAPFEEFSRIILQGFFAMVGAGNAGAFKTSGNYFSPNPNPLLHTWSLGVEEQFYFLFPILTLTTLRLSRSFRKVKFSRILVTTFFLSLIEFRFEFLHHVLKPFFGIEDTFNNFSFYSPASRVWEFCLGGIAAIYSDKISFRIRRSLLHFYFYSQLFLLFCPNLINQKLDIILICLITALLLNIMQSSQQSKKIENPIIAIGDKSYSIYLFHFPILYFIKYNSILATRASKVSQDLIIVILTLLIAYLNYHFIETRFRYSHSKPNKQKLLSVFGIWILSLPCLLLLHATSQSIQSNFTTSNRPIAAWDLKRPCILNTNLGCDWQMGTNSKSIILLGDSHAQQLEFSVSKIARKKEFNLVTWKDCFFTLRDSNHIFEPSCIANNKLAFEWALNSKPEYIILSNRMHANSNYSDLLFTLSQLKKAGKRVILIGNNPVFPDGSLFLNARMWNFYNPPKQMSRNLMDQDSLVAAKLSKVAARKARVTFLDTVTLFCSRSECSRFSLGKWLYWDGGHLSLEGAKMLEPSLNQIIVNGNH